MVEMRSFCVALVFGCFLSACSSEVSDNAQTPTVASDATDEILVRVEPVEDAMSETKTIVILGDSLTAGYNLAQSEALPAVIERRLKSNGLSVKLVNAGVSGDTTAMGLARYDWSVSSADPDILVIALGANDFLSGFPAEVAQENLEAIIERAQADGISVVLAGLEPRWPETYEMLQPGYAKLYPDLAEAYDVPLYEGFMRGVWDEPDLLMLDGLHPTVEGVEKMADRLTVFLAGQLAE